MAIAVSEAAATAIAAAIREGNVQQLAIYETFITYLELNYGKPGSLIPGTPAAVQLAQARAINDIPPILTTMLDQQQKMVSAIEVIQNALAGISSQIASGVTTQQVAVSDQIKMNKFKKQSANDALDRAGLPPVEVKEPAFKEATEEAVQDTLIFKSQIGISTLIERQISEAFAWVALTMADLIKNSFLGDAAEGVVKIIKGWLGIKEKEVTQVKSLAATKADARGILLGEPLPIGTAVQAATSPLP
jgi:hypothetical protein